MGSGGKIIRLKHTCSALFIESVFKRKSAANKFWHEQIPSVRRCVRLTSAKGTKQNDILTFDFFVADDAGAIFPGKLYFN